MWQLPPLKPEEIIDYLRKSQADDPTLTVEETLAKHEQRLDEWMDRNLPGMGPVPEENKYREVVSGETIDSRPAFWKSCAESNLQRSRPSNALILSVSAVAASKTSAAWLSC